MMKNSPRWILSVVFLWLLLPLMLQGLMVAGCVVIALVAKGLDAIAPNLVGDWLMVLMLVWLVLAVLASGWLCFYFGRKFVRQAYFSTPPLPVTRNFFYRYLGLVIVSGYSVALALVAICLPVGERGALLSMFNGIFTLGHLPALAVIYVPQALSKPALWLSFTPLALVYASYATGMAWQFRANKVPPTLRAGRVWFALLLSVSGVLFAWRYHAIHENYLSVSGRAFEEGGESDRHFWNDHELTRQYDPWEEDNRLVRIPAPTLNGEPLKLSDDCPHLDGATAFYPIYAALALTIYPSESLQKHLRVSSTPLAYKNLLSGSADIIFALKPSPTQLAEAKERGVEYHFTPLGRDAFVFFVNETNPVANLTEEQLRDIYTKRVTNWLQVGGRAEKILAFQRPPDSGSQTTMESLVMRGEPTAKPLMEEIVRGMGGIVREVAAYRDDAAAIGYSFLFFTREMAGWEKLRLLSVSGVSPSAEKIRSGEYPYIAEFYAVTTAASAEKPNVKKLLAWLQSAEGRELIEKTGYIASPVPE